MGSLLPLPTCAAAGAERQLLLLLPDAPVTPVTLWLLPRVYPRVLFFTRICCCLPAVAVAAADAAVAESTAADVTAAATAAAEMTAAIADAAATSTAVAVLLIPTLSIAVRVDLDAACCITHTHVSCTLRYDSPDSVRWISVPFECLRISDFSVSRSPGRRNPRRRRRRRRSSGHGSLSVLPGVACPRRLTSGLRLLGHRQPAAAVAANARERSVLSA